MPTMRVDFGAMHSASVESNNVTRFGVGILLQLNREVLPVVFLFKGWFKSARTIT